MSRDVTQRDATIDVARGIAIVLVVLGHNHAVSSSAPGFVDALFLFHVPLFFLLSGLVQKEQALGTAIATLARRLLLPYLGVAVAVGATKAFTRGQPLSDMFLGVAWGTGQTLPWSHLWFLPALFVTLLALQSLRRIRIAPRLLFFSVSLACAVALLTLRFPTGPYWAAYPAPIGWPWSVDLLPACLLFAALGALVREWQGLRQVVGNPVVGIAALGVFVACIGARVDLNLREFSPPVLALGAALAGCVAAFAASGLLARGFAAAPLSLVGRHTLVIFLLHVSIQKAIVAWAPSMSAPATFAFGLAAATVTIVITLTLSLLWDLMTRRRPRLPDTLPHEAPT
jgi:fucose 4-O-acetylase-like acetyltransferase